MQAPGLRIVIADDNPVVRAGLAALLSGRTDLEVVAEAADGQQAYEAVRLHLPDVILLDVRMPGVDGLSVLPSLVRLTTVMMLTYSREAEVVREALRLGAGGYLVHGEFTADELLAAVRHVREGRAHLTTTAATVLLAQLRGLTTDATANRTAMRSEQASALTEASRFPKPPGSLLSQVDLAQSEFKPAPQRGGGSARCPLSRREVEVMELIASGMSNAQIAATCFISEKTVKNHINRIFTKLGAGSRSQAIAMWLGTAWWGVG